MVLSAWFRRACVLVLFTVPGFAQAQLVNIDNAGLASLIDQGVPVIDVRTADEWLETGVVSDSHLMTFFDGLGRFDAGEWYSKLSRIAGPEDPVVLIYHTGVHSRVIGF